MIDYLKPLVEQAGIALSEQQLAQFAVYSGYLLEINQHMNLTAIKEPEEVALRHFLDSLLPLTLVEFPQNARLIDIGSGAGFPGLALKIARPDLDATLLDATNKRVRFLADAAKRIGVQAACLHARAEEAGRQAHLREQFDIACARAVSHLRELCEYCLPFVKVGGRFISLKGPQLEQELQEAQNALRELGGQVEAVQEYALPDGSGRTLVVVKKISQTSAKYPRPSAKMAKKPL